MLNSLTNRRKILPVDVGGRFCKRDAPNIIWEVSMTFRGSDGYPYAGMICLADRSQRKTLSLRELEDGEQYARVG
jgi:hypothetical protein